ncbi:DUF2335 domain-containing protein [Candidatus Magnetominusculus dajiuhuensis]|uniref:DUF2335 domain-containing protein n=1 Tax=Candidatus Magnetominusculus dajiuhuensis TaxID=3137712 RepID=UPI001A01A73A|nr:DUF2335 domain-containing protein [Nitrospirota bacterium]
MSKTIKKSKKINSGLMTTSPVHKEMPVPKVTGIISSHSGPLPDPVSFQRYEQVLPGTAERILSMAECEQRHAHKMRDEVLRQNEIALNLGANERKRGQIYGLTIGISGLAASLVALLLHAETTASIIGGTTVVSLVTAFVFKELFQGSKKEKEQTSPQSKA